jgi:hypothetical protein
MSGKFLLTFLWSINSDYFFPLGAGAPVGAVCGAPKGLAFLFDAGAVVSRSPALSFVCEVPSVLFPFGFPAELAVAMLNTKSRMANVHVAFSRKSAVRRTPITCEPALKPEASPPPFGFCTSTARIKMAQVRMMRIDKSVDITVIL